MLTLSWSWGSRYWETVREAAVCDGAKASAPTANNSIDETIIGIIFIPQVLKWNYANQESICSIGRVIRIVRQFICTQAPAPLLLFSWSYMQPTCKWKWKWVIAARGLDDDEIRVSQLPPFWEASRQKSLCHPPKSDDVSRQNSLPRVRSRVMSHFHCIQAFKNASSTDEQKIKLMFLRSSCITTLYDSITTYCNRD